MTSKWRAFVALILFGLLSLPCGCGRETSLDRLPVHGTVTMASGERLNGAITFLPAEGNSGPSVTTKLEEGKYQFDRTNGPTVGPHTVIIRRIVKRAEMLKAIKANQPVKQNGAEWTLSAEVADDGQFVQDFKLDK